MRRRDAITLAIGLCSCAIPCAAQREGWSQKPDAATSILTKLAATPAPTAASPPSTLGFMKDDPLLLRVRLQPARPRTAPAGATDTLRMVVAIWNRFGGLLEVLSRRAGVEPAMAVALVAAESGGRARSGDRLVIRFENHCFWHDWGQYHPRTYHRYFAHGRNGDRARGHTFRASESEDRKPVHVDQPAREWAVFRFAERLDRRAAVRSTSWGLGQIMGFNAERAGYPAPDTMVARFNDQQAGAHWQLIAIFDYMSRGNPSSRAITAFRNRDWTGVAREYNGSNVAEYAQRLRDFHAAARKLGI